MYEGVDKISTDHTLLHHVALSHHDRSMFFLSVMTCIGAVGPVKCEDSLIQPVLIR